MGRVTALKTGAVLVVAVGGLAAVVSASSARTPARPKVKAGSSWTLSAGTTCESDSFGAHRTFTAIDTSDGTSDGNAGRYKEAKRLTMTWKAGTAAGAVFQGTFSHGTGTYAGTYLLEGQSTPATLASSAVSGCDVVTTAPTQSSIDQGSTDADTATVTGEGGVTPTGTIHFYACAGSDACTATTSGVVDLGTADVSGSGSTATATSASFTPSATGDYCFEGVYSGDSHYPTAADGSTADECFTVAAASPPGPSVGLVALNKVGPHEVLAGGSGQFVVSGDLYLNTDVPTQPWSASAVDPGTGNSWEWDDAIDAKTNSNLYVYGTIHSNDSTYNGQPLWPLDTCFEPEVLGNGNPGGTPNPSYAAGDPTAQTPTIQMQCNAHSGSVNIDYDAIDPTVPQIDDPLEASEAPPNPLSSTTDIACPGGKNPNTVTNPAPQVVNGVTEYSPGEYTTPVEITTSAVFEPCAGGYTGIFRFDQGLWINPQSSGETVTGSNVLLATESPYPLAGNVPGSVTGGTFTASGGGNGAPCLPSGTMTSPASGDGTSMSETSSNACTGTNQTTYGVIGYGDSTFAPDPKETGTGNNFSLIIGGAAGTSVTLSGSTSGPYAGVDGNPGLVLYQDPDTQANDGFDAQAGDAADISINGVVYNASLSDYGASAPLDYWDGDGGGIPFYAGGTLQTGFGTGWSSGPAPSSGQVTLTGTAVVDDFNTDGATSMTIISEPYALPAGSMAAAISRGSRPSHRHATIPAASSRKSHTDHP